MIISGIFLCTCSFGVIKFETNRHHTHIHYVLSVKMEELSPLLFKANPSIMVWILFLLMNFRLAILASHSWIFHFSLSTRSFPLHTHIVLYLPSPRCSHSCYPVFVLPFIAELIGRGLIFIVFTSLSLYLTLEGLLFLPLSSHFTVAAVFKVTKACLHAAKCNGYLFKLILFNP